MSLEYVIDGYNVVHHPSFPRLSHRHLSPASRLIESIRFGNLTGSRRNKVTVVFDGYPDTQYSREDASSCLRVEFCRGRSADERIKDIIEQAAHPGNTVVVSDDKEIRFFIKAAGARALSVEEFLYPVLLRHRPSRQIEAPELTYSQKHKINQELKKLWLK